MNIQSDTFKRGYSWAKAEMNRGRTKEELNIYLCGPERTDFDCGAWEYMRDRDLLTTNLREQR